MDMEGHSGIYDPSGIYVDSDGMTSFDAGVATAFPSHSFGGQYMYQDLPNYELSTMVQQNVPQTMDYISSSTRSSASSDTRLSNNSLFSQHQYRGSVSSTNTTWSTTSRSSKDHHLSQTQRILNANSTAPEYRNPPQVQVSKPLSRNASQRSKHSVFPSQEAQIVVPQLCRSASQSSKRFAFPSQEPQAQVAQPARSAPQRFKNSVLPSQEPQLELAKPSVTTRNTTQPSTCPPQEPFTTCISRKKRARRSPKEPRYWCTSCHEPFLSKYDWKRHEETYQERLSTYHCDLCPKTYSLDKDFLHHHRESHRCQTCSQKNHLEIARRQRQQIRTGWGCGFCLRWDDDWTKRCNHVAWHFEKEGVTMGAWKQSQVVWSLLQQPALRREWLRLLDRKGEAYPNFKWSERTTGRVEGYPEAGKPPQLQDLLEYFTPGQDDAAALVELAYELGHRASKDVSVSRARSQRSQGSPPVPEKDFSDAPPPVPPKDGHYGGAGGAMTSAAHPASDEIIPWDRLIATIPEDDLLPEQDPMGFMEPYVDWNMEGANDLNGFF